MTVVNFNKVNSSLNNTWSGASCVPFYRVYVNGVFNDTVSGTSFSYRPPSPGSYFFQINSIDYFGREIGYISDVPYPWLGDNNNNYDCVIILIVYLFQLLLLLFVLVSTLVA